MWADRRLAQALGVASPVLARRVAQLTATPSPAPRDVRRAVLSTARYLVRAAGRPTPFGHFAGVQAASFGPSCDLRWGEGHHVVTRTSAARIARAIEQLERCPSVLARLDVTANTTVQVRGDRLVVSHRPLARPGGGTSAAETTLRHTRPVAFALAAARRPLRFRGLADKVHAEFPTANAEQVTGILSELVAQQVLITNLHAPATEPDPLGHILASLENAGADEVAVAAEPLADLRATSASGHGLLVSAVDLRLDADLVLPQTVADEAARAAQLLARLSAAPNGTAAWRAYHQKFYERYGRGALVPLLDVVADNGIGWPDGYPGARPAEKPRFDERDELLAALAQRAALDGAREVVLDEALLASLHLGPDEPRLPPHLEIVARVHALSQEALDRGDFRLEVVSVSRAAGVSVGRFLHLLEPGHRTAFTDLLTNLPTMDEHAVTAQLSFPPLDAATGHVARSLPTGQLVISLAEHRPAGDSVLGPEDLAVGCDGRRMYLAAPALGVRVEAAATHALNLRTHTPPLARLITELSRAQTAQVTRFDWGSLRTLPFRPRLRHRRVILSPAAWRLTAAELPAGNAPQQQWDEALTSWMKRRRAPRRVLLAADSQGLPLDLDHPGHRALLRDHLRSAPHAVLVEEPHPADLGWAGGRAHEIVVPATATRSPAWPRLPKPTPARILPRGHGDAPGTSRVLLASLYVDLERQDTVLTRHLPDLLDRLGNPKWWFVRFRDPRQHLRLRIALPSPAAFGPATTAISTWTAELHQAGLLSEVVYPTSYTETGRWGEGPAWAAAEEVFRADSAAVLAQLSQPALPGRQALLAAHALATAAGFTGSTTAGLRWLVDNVPAQAPATVPRPVFREAVRLADPARNWAALRAEPGGSAIADAWARRHQALDAYRRHFPGPHTQGVQADDVLGSLLHCSFVRAHRIDFDDEAQVLYLARAAALAHLSRDGDR
ncbi:thiopeptide-type bacteriocin biosynthesis protein [Kitasatospora sp. MAA19]|uniref:lantibiotic dehydratase n=1 Tax=Kitasatospora sp. MAA19 TaxID=3035090 RepID=UPI0024742322|nr:lantibiotic dehydratase [Kitasatospora sp. MAA19]MDH6709205.1 thiopeptide-type bacteriocin biosynthesis protein [Kitasatospora sp. MAA19]